MPPEGKDVQTGGIPACRTGEGRGGPSGLPAPLMPKSRSPNPPHKGEADEPL